VSATPLTDEIVKYLDCQFPATVGHIPIREKIGLIEIRLARLEAAAQALVDEDVMAIVQLKDNYGIIQELPATTKALADALKSE